MINLETKILQKAIAHVSSIVDGKSPQPVLNMIRVEAFNDQLSLSASDMDVWVTETIKTETPQPFSVLVDAIMLSTAIKSIKNHEATLTLDNEHLIVKASRQKFKLQTINDVDSFPEINQQENSVKFTVKGQDLKEMMQRTSYTMSQEEIRYYLMGVYFDFANNPPQIAATDGHKASIFTMCEGVDPSAPNVIVPAKTVKFIERNSSEEDVNVSVTETSIKFDFNGTSITSKLIDGTYPNYKGIIPNHTINPIVMDAAEMKEACQSVLAVAQKIDSNRVKWLVKEQKIISADEKNESTYEFEQPHTDCPDFDYICFNAKYMIDVVSAMSGQTAFYVDNTTGNPKPITVINGENTAIIMPMRG